jgi:hypothetical protein
VTPLDTDPDAEARRLLPRWHFDEAVETRVAAPAMRAFEAALDVSAREMALSSMLLMIRGLPGMVTRRRLPRLGSADPFWGQLVREPGFLALIEPRPAYAAFGYVGRPWKLSGERVQVVESADEFAAFDQPGFAKVVMDLSARRDGPGSILRTETRIHLTDEEARRAFARYWFVVRLGSIAIRKDWFRAARRRAERE